MTGPIVIKIGGTTLEDPVTSPILWDAIAKLAATKPEGVIVIHGGGKAVDRLLEKLGIGVERRQGLRVTPPEQMEYIAGVLAGSLNKSIVANLLKRGTRAVGMCLGDGAALPAARKVVDGIDLGLVGEVTITNRLAPGEGLLDILVSRGFIPVLSSIGIDPAGTWLNINADDAAAGVAWHVRAGTLLLMTDVPGIMDESKKVIPQIDEPGIENLIAKGVISGGMIPKARAAAGVAGKIGAPVVILSGNDPSSLGAWAAGQTVGTMVVPVAAAARR